MEKPSDKEILLKIKNGQIDKYSHLVQKYLSRIWGYLNKRVFDKDEIDDLVQNTFINFYKAILRFDVDKPVLPYLYQIAANEMKMYFRAKKTVYPLREELNLAAGEDEAEFEDYEKYLKILTKEQQKVLRLLSEGYTYREIGRKIDRPINTVRTMIRRSRLKIINLKNAEN